ncbi:MAG: thiamine pyrophosphate-binding protein [Dehalococcoidia bacterium]|nr:thiamine pyrophosphate-binding protein [Dehalococcoidia bacterium]
MPKMTGGQALMRSLHLEGIRVIFGLPGVQMYHAMDALYDHPDIRFITTRHEQATTYMADGFSRAGGGIGTALMVPGPGLLNASAGISTAYSASSPVLVVCGQIERDLIGSNRGMLHEINDQIDVLKPITKAARRIIDPTEIPSAVRDSFKDLTSGRPRPVEIEIPPETLAQSADIDLLEPEVEQRLSPDPAALAEAAQLLAEANRPLIWVGGGAISSEAGEEVVNLAEYIQSPVIMTAEGKGTISDRHPLSLGSLRLRNDPIAKEDPNFDVILAVGTRLAFPGWLGGQKVIQIDIDPEEAGRNYDNTHTVVGDAKVSLQQLLDRIQDLKNPAENVYGLVEALRKRRAETAIRVEPQESFLSAIRSAIPDDGILISGMTQMGYYARGFYPVYQPKTFMTSSYSGNLGYAFPFALGAKVAQPDKVVVALSGDGGFLFNSQELATAVQHNINAIVVVFNDSAYGNVMRDQVNRFDSRTIGVDLHNPDFMKLAEAYGARGLKANGHEELESVLKTAIEGDCPTLVEVPVGMMPTPFEN